MNRWGEPDERDQERQAEWDFWNDDDLAEFRSPLTAALAELLAEREPDAPF